jgi:hypothetical protein
MTPTKTKSVTEKDLLVAKARWRADLDAANDSREAMLDLIRRAVDEGTFTQAEIGRLYGWPRQRVAKHL